MQSDPSPEKPMKAKPTSTQQREDRLKAALKSNMARRKAQAKARDSDKENEDE